MSDELLAESWGDTNDAEMCWRIRASGLPLSAEDERLVRRLYDEHDNRESVYDLHRLNVLCHQAIGWAKGETRRAELEALRADADARADMAHANHAGALKHERERRLAAEARLKELEEKCRE